MKRILLDTNAYSRLMAGDRDVLSVLGSADLIYLSVFVIGELYTGFFGGGRAKDNRLQLEKFKSKSTVKVLAATEETAQIFGSIKNKLKHAGTPIPVNDIWIAAHTLETGSLLLTFDSHFSAIGGLRIADIGGQPDSRTP